MNIQAAKPLAVQEYLRAGGSPASLKADFGINGYRHPSLPLWGFKYNQIDSPKTHDVVRDCRGIVLEEGSWNVVAKPFRRFFNAGEDAENFAKFRWDDFTATTKEDGSLLIVYHYAGEWHANTSGSFGLGGCGFSGKSWRDLFWEVSRIDRAQLDPEYTYIFEFWTAFNRVIRTYPAPSAFLLSMFHVSTLAEASAAQADEWAARLAVPRPAHHHFGSLDEITGYLSDLSTRDKTFEGVVVRDCNDERYKIKSQTYLALHHLVDNGNIFNPKRLVPLVLAGDTDEVVAYVPEVKPHLDRVAATLDSEYASLVDLWLATRDIEDQATFAKSIVGKTKFSGLLFQIRKTKGSAEGETHLRAKWRESGDLIVKMLYGQREVA